jgi:site-specific recombinase XerD
MNETDFAIHIDGFLSRYLPGQRNLSTNTITSYRDAFKLNWQRILGLPMKKFARKAMSYFSPEGLHLLLSQPDTRTPKGRRDHALLVLLYDTAARVQEIIDLRVRDVRLEQPATVTLYGKGRKTRVVPVTAKTASIMEGYFQEKGWIGRSNASDFPVFMNSRKCKLSRAGVAYILSKHVKSMSIEGSHHVPGTVSPHCLRHTKAIHLPRSGVPLIYIRDILGQVSVTTTEIYAKVDAKEKRKALEEAYEVPSQDIIPSWEKDRGLMSWLSELCA